MSIGVEVEVEVEVEREREIRQVLTFVVKNCILTQGNYECAVDV